MGRATAIAWPTSICLRNLGAIWIKPRTEQPAVGVPQTVETFRNKER